MHGEKYHLHFFPLLDLTLLEAQALQHSSDSGSQSPANTMPSVLMPEIPQLGSPGQGSGDELGFKSRHLLVM